MAARRVKRATAASEVPLPTVPERPRPIPKPYLSIAELAELTPWTEQAIRTMMSRGVLREGEHYFHVGRRPVIKWTAIVCFVQRRDPAWGQEPDDPVPHFRDGDGWPDPGKRSGKPVRSK